MSQDESHLLDGYSLTTAKILYRLPDFESVLQTYIWQDYDFAPKYPKLQGFLEFWRKEIDGKLHSVHVNHRELISPSEVQFVKHEATLH